MLMVVHTNDFLGATTTHIVTYLPLKFTIAI